MSVQDPVLVDHGSFSFLPAELVEALNQTYFLHLLVTDPAKVIPPGKSLLSMLTHANFRPSSEKEANDKHAAILDRVTEVAHRAFWNEAFNSLSSPLPSVQLVRLKRLYLDLHEALTPLFPPNNRIIISLSSPIPPTSSPLHSTLALLKEILLALRQRCAPVRDPVVNELLDSLSNPPPANARPTEIQPPEYTPPSDPLPPQYSISPLAEFVIDTIKATISLADQMKSDLNTFVLGSMTEAQLQSVLQNDVKLRERELVLQIWDQNVARQQWRSWLADKPGEGSVVPEDKKWTVRLLRALGSDKAVYCNLPSPKSTLNGDSTADTPEVSQLLEPNQLPPQLFFASLTLENIQNYLQAIVIAAALRSLTRLPPSNPNSTGSDTSPTNFMGRIWTLLKAEIDMDESADAEGGTKVINLADEVVRARQLSSAPAPLEVEEEKRLRAAVERTLRANDPVFLLLEKRLLLALEKALLSDPSTAPNGSTSSIPEKMQTGRAFGGERAEKRPRLMFANASITPESTGARLGAGPVVPGFEDAVLQDAIREVSQKLVDCIAWTGSVWGDLI
ncbi:hypothetical protein B0H34DRAFT_653790 [Crassisporium funariophilum]|nr:hypothetical protein B0H34DRAFT_653790 [Crassisporium funariophilum]